MCSSTNCSPKDWSQTQLVQKSERASLIHQKTKQKHAHYFPDFRITAQKNAVSTHFNIALNTKFCISIPKFSIFMRYRFWSQNFDVYISFQGLEPNRSHEKQYHISVKIFNFKELSDYHPSARIGITREMRSCNTCPAELQALKNTSVPRQSINF